MPKGVSEDEMEVDNTFLVDGLEVTVIVTSLADQWVKLIDEVETSFATTDEELIVSNGFGFFELDVDDGVSEENMLVSGVTLLGEVTQIKVQVNSDNVSTFYIDRIDLNSNAYNTSELQLEQIKYSLRSIGLFAQLDLGKREDNILDELAKKIKPGSTALDIFAKQ